MAVAISFTMFGDEFFRRRILAARHRARDVSPVLDRIAEDWLEIVEEQFETEGARGGSKWEGLAFSTIKKRGSAHPILIDSGDMFQELITPENVRVTDDSVTMELGDQTVKAESHQYGFTNPQGAEVPARPIVQFRDDDRARWREWITDYLVNGRFG